MEYLYHYKDEWIELTDENLEPMIPMKILAQLAKSSYSRRYTDYWEAMRMVAPIKLHMMEHNSAFYPLSYNGSDSLKGLEVGGVKLSTIKLSHHLLYFPTKRDLSYRPTTLGRIKAHYDNSKPLL